MEQKLEESKTQVSNHYNKLDYDDSDIDDSQDDGGEHEGETGSTNGDHHAGMAF